MATVRFSNKLRDEILKKAESLFTTKLATVRESFNKEHLNDVYNKAFAPYQAHMQALPAEFFLKAKYMDVYMTPTSSPTRVEFPAEKVMPARPFTISGRFRFTPHYNTPDIHLDAECPEWQTIRDEYEIYANRVKEEVTKRNEFVTMVKTIIHAHETLAPALKVWPALWELIPEETKEKHKEIKEKRDKNNADMENVDLGKLTATVTVHKLRGQ
jgi:transcription-repair coupling factor (superfamily II helicase)